MAVAGEADEALRAAGFAPFGGEVDDGADDEDGSLGPPPRAPAFGGGIRSTPMQLGPRAVPIELWSSEKDSGTDVGFNCVHDLSHGVFYAKLNANIGEGQGHPAAERAMKCAITTLIDVAEACSARKITLGLGPEHVACADLICSLLYLGFQVVPLRKTPLVHAALMLDFDFGWPAPGGGLHSASDHTCSGTSDASTSAEDDRNESESPDSD